MEETTMDTKATLGRNEGVDTQETTKEAIVTEEPIVGTEASLGENKGDDAQEPTDDTVVT